MLKLIQTDGEKFYAAASTPSYACVDDGGTRADGRDAAASRRRAGRKHQVQTQEASGESAGRSGPVGRLRSPTEPGRSECSQKLKRVSLGPHDLGAEHPPERERPVLQDRAREGLG